MYGRMQQLLVKMLHYPANQDSSALRSGLHVSVHCIPVPAVQCSAAL
jgi:hypothetical protein